MVKFSIFMPTYNRQELFTKTLDSLLAQTYDNFELFLVDNGSVPSVGGIVTQINDPRIIYRRFDENIDLTPVVEDYLSIMTGSHFLFIGDDDALTPNALDIVASIFKQNKDIELFSVGYAKFNHVIKKGNVDITFDDIQEFTGKEIVLGFCSSWGIGPQKIFDGPRKAHPSASFISRALIERTRQHQKQLFIRPFGDVGYLGCCLYTPKVYYLDLPLTIVGDALDRDSQNMGAGRRKNLEQGAVFLEYSPLRGITFANLAVESHLKVLYRNKLDKIYDCRLRPKFYYRHLRQVISDNPWTWITIRDIAECICPFIISMIKYLTIKELAGKIILMSKAVNRIKAATSNERIDNLKSKELADSMKEDDRNTEELLFEDINHFARWVEMNYIKPRLRTSNGEKLSS